MCAEIRHTDLSFNLIYSYTTNSKELLSFKGSHYFLRRIILHFNQMHKNAFIQKKF